MSVCLAATEPGRTEGEIVGEGLRWLAASGGFAYDIAVASGPWATDIATARHFRHGTVIGDLKRAT